MKTEKGFTLFERRFPTLVLIEDFTGGGWNAFVPVTDDGRIDVTFNAIEKRCEVPHETDAI